MAAPTFIAYANNSTTSGTSVTVSSVDNTGTDGLVGCTTSKSSPSESPSTFLFNGTTMVKDFEDGFPRTAAYSDNESATGDVVITFATTTAFRLHVFTFTGVNGIGAGNFEQTTDANSYDMEITTEEDDSVLIMGGIINQTSDPTITMTSPAVEKDNSVLSGQQWHLSAYRETGTAGLFSLAGTGTFTAAYRGIIFELKPSAAVAAAPNRTLLGVGT